MKALRFGLGVLMQDDLKNEFSATSAGSETLPQDRATFWVRVIALCGSIIVAAISSWSARFSLNPDGLSYLDIADNYLHGNWTAAVNAYWSPLYSWVLTLGFRILRPSPYWELPTIQAINFVIFLMALAAFDVFWRTQGEHYQKTLHSSAESDKAAFPTWAWTAIGYAFFIWTLTNATLVSEVTPDLLVAAIVYVLASILVRMRAGDSRMGIFLLFGLILGAGYLGKTAMFVLAFPFLAVSFLTVRNRAKGLLRLIAASMVFLIVAAPFIFLISREKGRFTFGDSGRLGYAWVVNRAGPFFNWQGLPPSLDTPLHPTRKLLSAPALYEFSQPVAGTYPPHYDPSYWNDGMKPHFRFLPQVRVIFTSAYAIYTLIFLPQTGLITGAFLALFLSGSSSTVCRRIAQNWHLILPALAAFGLYALVTVEPRYLAGFLAMLWAAIFSSIRLPRQDWSKKLLVAMTIVAILTLSLSVAEKLAVRMYTWDARASNRSWQVANCLQQAGLQEGDRVITIGSGYNTYWAHLAKLKVVAEIPTGETDAFWGGSFAVQSEVFSIATQLGAKAIVTYNIPNGTLRESWKKIRDTGFYFYPLPQREKTGASQP
jgi:hypothetical protein